MIYKRDFYPIWATTKKMIWRISLYDKLDNSLIFEIRPSVTIYSIDEFLVYYLINDEASKIYDKLEGYIEVI